MLPTQKAGNDEGRRRALHVVRKSPVWKIYAFDLYGRLGAVIFRLSTRNLDLSHFTVANQLTVGSIFSKSLQIMAHQSEPN